MKGDEFNTIEKLSAKKVADLFEVPYWLITGSKPSWREDPRRRLKALWWRWRWDRTIYNGHGEFKNGIVWWRYTSGPLKGYGIWRLNTREMQVEHATAPEDPCSYIGYFRGQRIYVLLPEEVRP